jgi:transposase
MWALHCLSRGKREPEVRRGIKPDSRINHLKARNMEVKHGILDAGHHSARNIRDLYDSKIPFLIRPPNALAKTLIKEHGTDVSCTKYALEYGNRLLSMKRVPLKLYDYDCYAYIALDFERMADEQERYYRKAVENREKKSTDAEMPKDKFGYFVLISSEKLESSEVMPLYYMCQTFDFAKNDVALMPVCGHNDATFRGHLLLSFMATVMLITVKRVLKTRKKLSMIPAVQSLRSMRYIKCDAFPCALVTSEPDKHANMLINELNLEIPGALNL